MNESPPPDTPTISAAIDRALADATVWDDPPPRLRSQLLATAAVEQQRRPRIDRSPATMAMGASTVGGDRDRDDLQTIEVDQHDAEVADVERAHADRGGVDLVADSDDHRDDVGDPDDESHRAERGRVLVLRSAGIRRALAAAAVLVALVVGGSLMLRPDGPADDVTVAMYSPSGASGATAVATLRPLPSGMEVVLVTNGLTPAEPGTYYAAWLRGDAGMIPIGSFHARGGDDVPIVLWSAVPAADFPTVMVTGQQIGDPPVPSDVVVLSGTLEARP